MKRIIIVGVSGSGKTYTAKKLGKLLNIHSYDLDEYYWNPNWQKKDRQEFTNTVTKIVSAETWIVSGNFSSFDQAIWQRCDSVIWLDYSFFRCLAQSLKRSLKRIVYKIPCCNGNYETFSQLFFSRNSIILWVLRSYNKRRAFYSEIFNDLSNKKTLIRFQSPKETNKWFKQL